MGKQLLLIVRQFTLNFMISRKISYYHELREIIQGGPKILVGSVCVCLYQCVTRINICELPILLLFVWLSTQKERSDKPTPKKETVQSSKDGKKTLIHKFLWKQYMYLYQNMCISFEGFLSMN